MNPRNPAVTVATLAFALQQTGCDVAQGVFKGGFWVGMFGVFAVAVLVFLALSLVRR